MMKWAHLLEISKTLKLDDYITICMISSQFDLWRTYYIVLCFLKETKKKSSLKILAVMSKGPQQPSSSQDNLIGGVQLSNRLKKNKRARGQQTNVARTW